MSGRDVRTYSGVPPAAAFGGDDGTPLIIDITSGPPCNAYILIGNTVVQVGGGGGGLTRQVSYWDAAAVGTQPIAARTISELLGLSVLTYTANGLNTNTIKCTKSFTVGAKAVQWEMQMDGDSASPGASMTGVIDSGWTSGTMNNYLGNDIHGWAYYAATGNRYNNGANSGYGVTYSTVYQDRDILTFTVALDGKLVIYKNNNTQGIMTTLAAASVWFPAWGSGSSGGTRRVIYNDGSVQALVYPQVGFTALGLA